MEVPPPPGNSTPLLHVFFLIVGRNSNSLQACITLKFCAIKIARSNYRHPKVSHISVSASFVNTVIIDRVKNNRICV